MNDNWRSTSVAVNLCGADFQQTLLLFLANQEHEVEEGSSRMRYSIVWPASKLQMCYVARLQRLHQPQDGHQCFAAQCIHRQQTLDDWLRVKVLRPTRHKMGHFGDVPQANLLAWYGKNQT